MPLTYQNFIKKSISLELLGVGCRENGYPYFCTPKGAQIFGWAGVDGIHFCRIRGFGEMVFAISPMNCPGEYVHPVAENFEDFLRLLLACGDSAALEQAWQWDEAAFLQFLEENQPGKEQREIMELLKKSCKLEAMEQPWQYIKQLQDKFDYSKIKFTEDYYDPDMNPDAPEPKAEWKVYFEGGFWKYHGRERAGREVPVNKEFSWAGYTFVVPAVYLCGKGMVVDICRKVEPEKMTAFMEKWNLTPENEAERQFTSQEMQQIEKENPLTFDFRMKLNLNGSKLQQRHGYGTTYNACVPGNFADNREAKAVVEHYHLDASCCWSIMRWCFLWNTKRKPDISSLEITMMQEKVAVPGITFSVSRPGDMVEFTYPKGGTTYVLTVQEYEQKELFMERMGSEELEYPTYHHAMMYQIEPELPKGLLRISDAEEGDQPRRKLGVMENEYGPTMAASIGIIGGADGPTAMFLGSPKPQVVFSSLHFEPMETVNWQMTFYEKMVEDETINLFLKK